MDVILFITDLKETEGKWVMDFDSLIASIDEKQK